MKRLAAEPLVARPVRDAPPPRYPKKSAPLPVDLGDRRTWPFAAAVVAVALATAGCVSTTTSAPGDGGTTDAPTRRTKPSSGLISGKGGPAAVPPEVFGY